MQVNSTHPASLIKFLYGDIHSLLSDALTAECLDDLPVSKELREHPSYCGSSSQPTIAGEQRVRTHGLVNMISEAPNVHRVVRDEKKDFHGRTPQTVGSSRLSASSISKNLDLEQYIRTPKYDSTLEWWPEIALGKLCLKNR